jgi:hypothetical protein
LYQGPSLFAEDDPHEVYLGYGQPLERIDPLPKLTCGSRLEGIDAREGLERIAKPDHLVCRFALFLLLSQHRLHHLGLFRCSRALNLRCGRGGLFVSGAGNRDHEKTEDEERI